MIVISMILLIWTIYTGRDSHTLIYFVPCRYMTKSRLTIVSTRVWRTDGRTDGLTDGRTLSLGEMRDVSENYLAMLFQSLSVEWNPIRVHSGTVVWFVWVQRHIFTFMTIDERRYGVIHKKVSHETEDKMQEKMKMILQVDGNLAHLKQQYS